MTDIAPLRICAKCALCDFAHKNYDALNAISTAFVSVSLSAAGSNPSDLAGLRGCVDRLERDTLWRPVAVNHAAGAMPLSAYGFFMKLAIQFIARKRGQIVKTSEDYSFDLRRRDEQEPRGWIDKATDQRRLRSSASKSG